MLDDSNLTVTETTRIGPSAGNSVMPLVKSNCADVPSELREPAVIRNRRRKNAQPRNITDRYEVSDVTYYDEYDDSSVGIMTSQLWPTGSFDTDNDDVSSDANIDEMDAEDRSTAHTCDTEVLDLSVKAMRKSEERVIEKKELVVDEHGVLDLTARGSASRRENSITVAGQPASSRNSSADWNGNSSEGNKYGADHRSERTHLNKREEGGYRDSAIADMLTMYGYQEYAELSQFGPYTSRSANNIFFVTNSMSHPGSSISYSVNSSMSNQLPLASSAAASHSKIFSVASPPSPSDDDPHSLSFSSSEGTTDLAMRPPNDFTMKVSSQSPSNRQQQQVSALTGMGLTHANNSKSSLTHKIINSVQRLAKSNHAKTAVHNLATSSSYIQACFDPHMAPKVADAVSSSGLRGVLPDYSKYLKRYLSSDECGKRECRELGYREHFHCLDCKSRVIGKKEDMVRHYKWHKKRDDSLQHGFMRYSPRDDCSKKYSACAHNGRQTHYHCLQVGCNKVYISTSDVQMHSNYHRKDSAIIQEGFQRFRATEDCGSQSCTFYGQRTTHFHCRRSGCNFTFKNKADMEKHKIYHQRDEALTRDGFKKFMKYENCQFSNCRYSKLTNHIHCIRPGCNYVLHSTGQLFSHKRKHERRNLELTYKQLHGKKAGKGMFHVPAVRRNNVVNRAFNFAHPIKGIAVNNPYSSLIGYPPVAAFAQQEEGDFEESDETGTSNHMSAMDDVDPYDCEPATNQMSNMDDMDLYDSGTNQLSAMDDTDLYDSDSSESRDLVIDENISKAKLSGRAKQETDDSLTFNKFNIKEENPHSQYDSIKTVANIETTAKNKNKEAANTNIKTATKTKNKFASLKGETEAAKLNALVMKTNGTETNFDAKFMADVENSEKDDEFENKDDDLENKDNDVSSNKDCSSANSHLTSPENKPRSSQLDVKVDSTDKDDEISESKSPIEMEELGSDPVVKSLSPQMAVAPADFVPKASPAVNGKRERDETWKKYLTRFTANDPCHAQCPFLYKDHYHCNTSTCRVLFRSKDGVRDHARCHQQQDQVTTMSYDIFEANTACHNESCQLSCAKKHYHCRWPGCAQVLSDDDGPFSRLEHNKIHMFARSNVMKRSPTSIPNYLSSISTDSGSVGTASGTISDILPLNNRRRGRPPKYPKNDIPVIPKPNMTEAEIQERAKATGDPIIASGFRRYASDESCPDEQCIYASSEHYHCVRERCHHSTNHRDVLNLHARDFHSHITILDGFEFFDREIDCRRSHCNNNRVNRHFHCTRSRCDYSFVRYSTMIQHDRKHASPDSVGVLPHMTSGSSKIFGNDARSGVQGATDDISQKFGVYNQRIGAGAILNNMTRVSSMVPQIKPGLLPANTTSLISDSSAKLFSASRHRAIAPKPIQPLTVAVGISPLAVSTGTLYNNEHSAPVLQNSKMHFSTTENCGRPFCKLKKRDHFHCSLCNQAFSDNARLSHHWSKHVNKANITDYNTPSSSSYGIYNESNINEDWADGINDEDGDEEEEEEEEGDLSKMWFQSAVSRSQSLNLDPNTFSGLSHSLTLNPHSFSGLVGNPLLGGIDMSSNHGNLGNSNFGDSSAVDLSGKIRSVKTSPQLQVLKSQSQAVLANFSQQKLAKREALWLTSVEDNGGIESSGSRYSDDEEIASKFPSSAINSVNLLQPMRRRLAPDMSEQNPSKMRKVVTDRLQQHLSMKRAAIGSPSHNLSIIPSNHNSPITAGVNSNLFSINTFNQ